MISRGSAFLGCRAVTANTFQPSVSGLTVGTKAPSGPQIWMYMEEIMLSFWLSLQLEQSPVPWPCRQHTYSDVCSCVSVLPLIQTAALHCLALSLIHAVKYFHKLSSVSSGGGWRRLPVWEGEPEPVGWAGPVGQTASSTPLLPCWDLHSGFRRSGPGAGAADPYTDLSGQSQSAELPAGPGLSAGTARVLLHHGAQPAAAVAPEGLPDSGCAGEAQGEELTCLGWSFKKDQENVFLLKRKLKLIFFFYFT